jgi:propionaldehyde dehydrogenase
VYLNRLSEKKPLAPVRENPPVVVDETADIEKAGHDIIAGSTFDNNIPCIAEKENYSCG